jgi:hypothetical protein
MTPNRRGASTKAMFLVLLLAGCAQPQIAKENAPEEHADAGLGKCGYLQSHDIWYRLRCLRATLDEIMLPPNSRLVSDASASARRASYSAPQSER